ncbi:MAG: diaminopimelate decarboxylase [Acidimicrobiales bacterium]
MPRDGPPRLRRGHAPRRVDGRGVPRRRAAGVPASALTLHGNNKSTDELRLALTEGVGHVVVDSFDELDRIDALVAEGSRRLASCCGSRPASRRTRTSSSRPARTTRSSGSGCTPAAQAAFERASASPSVELVGLHMHIGSQIFDAESFQRAIEVLAPWFRDHRLPELCVGGGLGVPYVAGESSATITEWAATVHAAVAAAGIDARVSAEPGRAIAAAAGLTLYTVGTIKDIPDIRTYVAVDGGMSDNPRPVLYGSGYEAFLPRASDAPRRRQVTVVGKHCESGDVLVRDGWVPEDLAVGDVLATPVTGAYGASMGSNYNKVPRPAVVFVADGAARLVVRRESYDDLLRSDV